MLNMMSLGWDSPHLQMAIKRFEKLAIELAATLETSEWLAGDVYSLADADYTPYLQRMEDLDSAGFGRIAGLGKLVCRVRRRLICSGRR